MVRDARWLWWPIALLLAAGAGAGPPQSTANCPPGKGGGGSGGGSGSGPIVIDGGLGGAIAIVGNGYSPFDYASPYYYPPPMIFTGPVVLPPSFPTGQGGGGLRLPMPPREFAEPAATAPPRPRRPNPERARELVEIGDRSFRGGNTRRAEERYLLAARADPTSPAPHLHLAQVALVRKDYGDAAGHIREAVAASPGSGWLSNVADIQAIFAEPGDFARHLGRLESHLQAHPGDRDAWFVLGVEWFLSGRTQQAGDAFRRLTDRKPDEALAAFLDAATPRPRPAN